MTNVQNAGVKSLLFSSFFVPDIPGAQGQPTGSERMDH